MRVRYHLGQSSQDCALGLIHATIYQFATHTDEVWKEYIKNQKAPEPDDDFQVV